MKSETKRNQQRLTIGLSREVSLVFAVRITHQPTKSQRRDYESNLPTN
jgi:hypothetical protein